MNAFSLTGRLISIARIFLCCVTFPAALSVVSAQTVSWTQSISDTGAGTTRSVIRLGSAGDYVSASIVKSTTASIVRIIRHGASDGAVGWTRDLNKGRSNDVNDIVYDSANNAIYVAIRASASPTTTTLYHLNWWIIRLNATTGEEQWTYTYNGASVDGNDEVYSIAVCPDGNVVGVGNAEAGVRARVAKLKGSDGSLIWAFMENDSSIVRAFSKVACDSSGNIYAVGFKDPAGAGVNGIYIAKFPSNSATPTWQTVWKGAANLFASPSDVVINSANEPVICGNYRPSGTTQDFLVLKVNPSDGSEVWNYTVSGTASATTDQALTLKLDASDNIYAAGFVRDTVSSATDRVAYATKLNNQGALQWSYKKNGSGAAAPNGGDRYFGLQLSGSSVYLYGTQENSNLDLQGAKLDAATGAEQWVFTYNPSGAIDSTFGSRTCFAVDSADAIVIAGEVGSPATSGLVAKVGPSVAAAPEIEVSENSSNVADGGSFSFGTTPVGTSVTKTFTVKNTGTANLTLSSLSVPTGFSIAAGFGSTTVAGGSSTTFQVTMTASAAGTPSGSLSFTNNDSDENPYNFTVSGTVSAPTLTINDVTLAEGNSGTTSYTFTVSLSAPAPAAGVTFDIATANGTASSSSDYTAKSLTGQTIPAGSSTYSFTVLVNGDTTYELNETFLVNVSNISGATALDSQGLGILVNDDAAPTLSLDSAIAVEGDSGTTPMTFTVSLSAASGQTTTVNYATANGTATTTDGDYVANSGTLTFAPGDTVKTVTVTVNGDTKYEGNETMSLTLSSPSNATISTGTAAGTIINDDSVPAFSINSPSVTEGNSGTTTLTFTVSLSAASGFPASVDYATADGTATTADGDYTTTSGTLSFSAGQTSKTITVVINGDTKYEANETLSVTLSNASGASIATGTGTGTITNDDAAIALSVDSPSVSEGNSGTTTLTFSVTLAAASGQTTTVNYTTADGTATTADNDYTAASGTLTFSPGTTTQTVSVTVKGDTKYEANETLALTLSNPVNATLGTASGTGTITNDDSAPVLSVDSPSANEGNSGTSNLTFTVTLSAVSGQTATVAYATTDGTATTADGDYSATSGLLTFAPGETSKTVNVTVSGDTKYELNETFSLNLSAATNATISTGQGTGTLLNDDAQPALSVNSPSVSEGNAGTTSLVFTVSLSAASSQTVTVDYASADGTAATADADYTAVNGSLIFTAGQTSKTVTVLVNGDVKYEANETFTLTLGNPVNATIATASGTGTGTITNDDTQPVLSINSPSVAEGDSGTANATFTVTLSTMSSQTITVNFATADGTATIADNDYTASNGTLTFAPGETTKSFNVAVNGDTKNEANETFSSVLSSASNATIGTATGTATITNDDAVPSLAIASPSVTEGNSGTTAATFTVTLSAVSGQTVTMNYATADASATTADDDYAAASGTLTFAPGDTSKTFAVTVNGDTKSEADENFTVSLSSPVNATISTATGTATITNDDAAPGLSINSPAAVSEGNSGTKTITFTATLASVSGQTVTVNYATADNTATTADNDYTAASGTLTFTPGQTTKSIVVTVQGDTKVEADETFSVTLSGAANATISTASGTGTITNDDAATVSVAKLSDGAESNTPTPGAFSITQSGVSSLDTVVNLSVSGTATSGSDFSGLPATATIPAGDTSVDVPVTVLNDNVIESTETVVLTLSNLGAHQTGISIAASPGNSASLSITDNDVVSSIAVSSGSGQNATAGTAFASPLIAIVKDAGGTPLTGASVTFTANGATASGSFGSSATVVSDASGLATAPTFSANNTAGSYTVTSATAGVSASAIFSLTNNPAAASHLVVTAPVTAIAGTPVSVTVAAYDAFENLTPAFAGTVHLTSTDGAAILPADSTLSSGTKTFSVNFATGGSQTVTATSSSVTGISGSVTVSPRADLEVTLTAAPDPVSALGTLTYTIGLTNYGPSASVAPVVSLPLPAGTTFATATAAGGWSASTPAIGGTGTVNFSAPSLASGGTASFTVTAKVNLNVVNNSTLSATATASETIVDPVAVNDSATAAVTARSGADLESLLTAAPEPVIAGTDLTYTLRLKNHGPLEAQDAALSFSLPAGTRFVSLSENGGWTATTPPVGASGLVLLSSPQFAVDGDVSFTLVVKVDSNVEKNTVLDASLNAGSSTVDIAPGNNTALASSVVSTQSNLAVTLASSPETAPKNTDVNFAIHFTNNGPSDAVNPLVSFPVPAGMTFVSASAPGGWTVSAPAAGGQGTVIFTSSGTVTGGTADFVVIAKVKNDVANGTIIEGTVSVSSDGTPPVIAHDDTSGGTAIGTDLPVVIQPAATGTLSSQSGLFELIVNVTNTTPSPINGFRLHVDYSAYLAAYPSLRLYNASSAAGSPDVYVDYPYPMAVDGTVAVKLSFYTSTRTFPNPFSPILTLEILPSSALPVGAAGAPVQAMISQVTDGNMQLKFPTVAGHWYRVQYSSDLVEWYDSPVPVQAGANRTQWIDRGAPYTISPPSSVPRRFYRVAEIAAP